MSRGVQRLWTFLARRKLSQAQFAIKAGMGRSYLNQILNDRLEPGKAAMTRIEIASGGFVRAHHWMMPKAKIRRRQAK